MKRVILLALGMASMIASQAQTINVTIKDTKADSVKVTLNPAGFKGESKTETIALKKGSFTYSTGDEEQARLISVEYAKEGLPEPISNTLLVMPGEKASVTINTGTEHWKGGDFYKEMQKLLDKTNPLYADINSAIEEYMKRLQNGEDRSALVNELNPRITAAQQKLNEQMKAYAKENPASDVSAFCLFNLQQDLTQEMLDALDAKVKMGRMRSFVTYMQNNLDRAKLEAEQQKKVADGKEAPTFTLKDINGNDLALESLRGKYVILDFWGSWCGWCIKGIPEMKKAYDKYKDRMEILGIDCNDKEEAWKAAVEKYELPWLHVYNPRTSDVLQKYAIKGFPTKVVVDPEGRIVKTVVGEDPKFYTFLDELFSK